MVLLVFGFLVNFWVISVFFSKIFVNFVEKNYIYCYTLYECKKSRGEIHDEKVKIKSDFRFDY